MNIVFMGTPDFAVPCLRALLEDGHRVSLVVTQADKPKGRGHRLTAPPVKELALTSGIPVFQPTTLKNEMCIRDRGQVLLVLEAMKMENEIMSPRDGVVAGVHVSKGESVDSGKLLVSLQ